MIQNSPVRAVPAAETILHCERTDGVERRRVFLLAPVPVVGVNAGRPPVFDCLVQRLARKVEPAPIEPDGLPIRSG
jgi:hypothetical protein